MSISTQAPALRGIHTGNAKTSRRAEFTTAVRGRLGRLTGAAGCDSTPDACREVVDATSGTPQPPPAHTEGMRGRFAGLLGLTGSRFLLAGRTRGVLVLLLLIVAVTASALTWFSWPSPQPAPGAVAVAQTNDGDGGAVGRLKVSVVGDVSEPGIVELAAGARVADAIEAAGGLSPESASPGYLNLARKVKDGELIVVEAEGENPDDPEAPAEPDPSEEPPTGDAPDAPSEPVNLNKATEDELATLPGIGPVTAASIVEYREQSGGFDSVDQLTEVDGIGPATLDKLADKVTV